MDYNTESDKILKTDSKSLFREGDHIYFRCSVTIENVSKLRKLLQDYYDLYSWLITAKENPSRTIYIHITSFGGDILAANYAYSFIKHPKFTICTIIEDFVINEAVILFMAGQIRCMTIGSYIKINSWGFNYDLQPFDDEKKIVLQHMDKICDIILANIRCQNSCDILTKEKLKEFMINGIYWNSYVCNKYGLVDRIHDCLSNDELNKKSKL